MPETKTAEGFSLISMILLSIAAAITIALFTIGDTIAPEIKQLGLMGYIKQYEFKGGFVVFSFTFAFPFALHLIALAGLLNRSRQKSYVLWTTLFFAAGSILVVVWPFIAGNENSRYYFMIGGSLLLVMIFLVTWFWTEQRQKHDRAYRHIMDLRGMGYFFFAMATWNSCGLAGMPGYALYPQRSLEVNAYPFIIGQTKVIMLYFILAWLFILVSYVFKRKLRKNKEL